MLVAQTSCPGSLKRSRRNFGLVASAIAITLTACGGGDSNDAARTGISEGEARALDEAAEMLDEKQLPDDAIPPLEGAETPDDAPAQEPAQTPSE